MTKLHNFLIIILLIWAISATILAFTYYQKYIETEKLHRGQIIYVDIGINYGNGTLIWFNSTRLLAGASAYQALLLVANNVNASEGVYGVYIHGINNVNEYDDVYWFYAIYNRSVPTWVKVGEWIYPSIASNNLILQDKDIVVWVFFNYAKYASNFPVPTSTDYLR